MVTIISGGQTGVDRGALDAALLANVLCGGWCPEGRRADDGPIDEKYPLHVLVGSGYRERTRQNVIDSDGTVIIYFGRIYPKGGTEQTLLECIDANRPYLLIDGDEISVSRASKRIAEFVADNRIERLNIAGPKAKGVSKAHSYAQAAVQGFLQQVECAN